MSQSNCLNCEVPLLQGQNFCSNCGQRSNVHRLNFHELSHELIHAVTHADKSVFKLVKDLLARPGVVAREYVAGKRTKYFKPLGFFLLVAGVVVFMTSSFYSPNTRNTVQIEAAAEKMQDAEKKKKLLQQAARIKNVGKITGKYSNVINMIATPFLTFLFWIFYRKQFNYIEALVANMYFVGLIMIVYALLLVPVQNLFPIYGRVFLSAFFIFEIVYRGFAYYQFANKKGLWSAVKAYGVSFLVSAVWVFATYSLISKYIRTGF